MGENISRAEASTTRLAGAASPVYGPTSLLRSASFLVSLLRVLCSIDFRLSVRGHGSAAVVSTLACAA